MIRWLWLLPLGACTEEAPTDEDRIAAILDLAGDEAAGEERYAESCASCHGDDGSGVDGNTALSGSDIRGLDRERVVTTVVSPPVGMLTFDTLPEQDVADVAAFVGGL